MECAVSAAKRLHNRGTLSVAPRAGYITHVLHAQPVHNLYA